VKKNKSLSKLTTNWSVMNMVCLNKSVLNGHPW